MTMAKDTLSQEEWHSLMLVGFLLHLCSILTLSLLNDAAYIQGSSVLLSHCPAVNHCLWKSPHRPTQKSALLIL
jgi:hypothetical protein